MARKQRRGRRAEKKYNLYTGQPQAETHFEEFDDGVLMHVAKTRAGAFSYTYTRERVSKTLWSLFAHFLLGARAGGPVDLEEFARSVGADQPFDITVDVDQAFVDEAHACTMHALELLDTLAPRLLAHASEQLVFEVFYRAICDRRSEGTYDFRASESELLTMLSELAVRRLKQRVTPRRKPSSKLEWTPERCEEYLAKYEYALDVLQRAKGIYQRNRDDEWRSMVKAVFPALPDRYLDRLPLKGDAEPSDMAREYAAELYGVNDTSYLKKIIGRAKGARQQKAA